MTATTAERVIMAGVIAWKCGYGFAPVFDAVDAFMSAQEDLASKIHGLEYSRLRDDLERVICATARVRDVPAAVGAWRAKYLEPP